MLGFGWRGDILVIGAVHIDTIVEPDKQKIPVRNIAFNADIYQDNPGKVHQSVGGGAFNIAVNLADNAALPRRSVALYTLLPRSSVFTNAIVRHLRRANICTSYVQQVDTVAEREVFLGGYVGVRDPVSQEIALAVTSTCVDRINPFADNQQARTLARLIKRAKIVVIDTNLKEDAIDSIIALAGEKNVLIQIVSDAKSRRYIQPSRTFSKRAAFTCGKPHEVATILADEAASKANLEKLLEAATDGQDWDGVLTANEICDRAMVENLVCAGRNNFLLISRDEKLGHFRSLAGPRSLIEQRFSGSLTGVDDAIMAAALGVFAARPRLWGDVYGRNNPRIDAVRFEHLQQLVKMHVSRIIEVEGATRYSGISDNNRDLRTLLGRLREFLIDHWEIIALFLAGALLAASSSMGIR